MVVGKLNIHIQNNNTALLFHKIYKNKFKMDQRHKFKTETTRRKHRGNWKTSGLAIIFF
jgi:hypothetical protein